MLRCFLLCLLVPIVFSKPYDPDEITLLEDYRHPEEIPQDEIIELVRDIEVSVNSMKNFIAFRKKIRSYIAKRSDETSENFDDTKHITKDRLGRKFELALVADEEKREIAIRLTKDLYQLKFPDKKRPTEVTELLKKELKASLVKLSPLTVKEYKYQTSLLVLGLKKVYISLTEDFIRSENKYLRQEGKEVMKRSPNYWKNLERQKKGKIEWSMEPDEESVEVDDGSDFLQESGIHVDYDGYYVYGRKNPLSDFKQSSKQMSLDYYHILFPDEERPTKLTEEHKKKAQSAPAEARLKADERYNNWLIELSSDFEIGKVYLSEEEYSDRQDAFYEKKAELKELKVRNLV